MTESNIQLLQFPYLELEVAREEVFRGYLRGKALGLLDAGLDRLLGRDEEYAVLGLALVGAHAQLVHQELHCPLQVLRLHLGLVC